MPCYLASAKPLLEPMVEYCYLTLGNKLQRNLYKNLYISIQENAVVWKMASILYQPQCVDTWAC